MDVVKGGYRIKSEMTCDQKAMGLPLTMFAVFSAVNVGVSEEYLSCLYCPFGVEA
jgi:hypothetical protein